MSLNPYQPPLADPSASEVLARVIPSFSARWILGCCGVIVVVFTIVLTGEWRLIPSAMETVFPLFSPFLLLPLVFLIATPLILRSLERQLHFLPVRPGDGPSDNAMAVKMGLASRGFPLNSGALVLTPEELVFYRRRFRRWAEEMRIPLEEIVKVEMRRSLPHSKLILGFRNGGSLTFRALYAGRWCGAIREILEQS